MTDEIIDLKKRLSAIRLKTMNMKAELRNMEEEKRDIKEKLLKLCPHKHVICYRYYSSGMHRPEYSRECKECHQYLDFDQYVKAETTEDRDG